MLLRPSCALQMHVQNYWWGYDDLFEVLYACRSSLCANHNNLVSGVEFDSFTAFLTCKSFTLISHFITCVSSDDASMEPMEALISNEELSFSYGIVHLNHYFVIGTKRRNKIHVGEGTVLLQHSWVLQHY